MEPINPREILKQARARKGWSEHDVAARWDNYYDIEAHDSELTYVCSLNEICGLCQLLDISPKDLFSIPNIPPLAIEALIEKIKDHCTKTGISIEQFEDKAGWRVESCLTNPQAASDEWNLDCLKDVCRELQVDWRGVVSSF